MLAENGGQAATASKRRFQLEPVLSTSWQGWREPTKHAPPPVASCPQGREAPPGPLPPVGRPRPPARSQHPRPSRPPSAAQQHQQALEAALGTAAAAPLRAPGRQAVRNAVCVSSSKDTAGMTEPQVVFPRFLGPCGFTPLAVILAGFQQDHETASCGHSRRPAAQAQKPPAERG